MALNDLEPHYRMLRPESLQPVERAPLHIVLDNIRSAYNTGSMFRTADAAAAEHVHLCGMTAYPPNAKLAKTALGAFDYIPWTHYPHTPDAVAALREQGVTIVAVEVTPEAVPYTDYAWPRPAAVIFGNEVTGVAPETLALADAVVRIPMRGHKKTINVATAFGIVVYEVIRRWGYL